MRKQTDQSLRGSVTNRSHSIVRNCLSLCIAAALLSPTNQPVRAEDTTSSVVLLEPELLSEGDLQNERHTISLAEKIGSDDASFIDLTDDKGRSYSAFRNFLDGFSPRVVLFLSPSQALVQTNKMNGDASESLKRWREFRSFIQKQAEDGVNFFGSPKSLDPWRQELATTKEKIYLFDGTQLSAVSLIDAAILIYLEQMKVSAPAATYPKLAMVPLSPACAITAASEGEALADVCKDSVGNEPFRAELQKGSVVLTRLDGKAGEAFVEVHPARSTEPQMVQSKRAVRSKFKVSVPALSPYINNGPEVCNCSGTVAMSERCYVQCKKQCDYNLLSFSNKNSRLVEGALSKTSCLTEVYKACGGNGSMGDLHNLASSNSDDCFFYALAHWGAVQAEESMYRCYLRNEPKRFINQEDLRSITSGKASVDRVGVSYLQREFPGGLQGSRLGGASNRDLKLDPRKWLKAWYSGERHSTVMKTQMEGGGFRPIFSAGENPVAQFFSASVNNECRKESSSYDSSPPPTATRFRGAFMPNFTTPRRVVFNSKCQVIANDENVDTSRVCSTSTYRTLLTESPISLLWNAESDLNRAVALTSFPLNPRSQGKTYHWKASAETPLLVYDPEGTGKITSATQLFGNWTFGHADKVRLKKVGMDRSDKLSKPLWKNGYEALALLDDDNNGEITGAERQDLALWFDSNQNGISEDGEVRNLIASGVERISVKQSGKDAEGDIYSTAGFSRRLPNGELLTNRTVDWFSPSFDSKHDAINSLSPAPEENNALLQPQQSEIVGASASVASSRFNGTWRYTLEEKGAEASSKASTLGYNSGLLRLQVEESGEVSGFTLSESPVSSTKEPASSIAFFQPLKGRLVDATTVEFSLPRIDGAGNLVSRVSLRDNGEIVGKTSVQASRATGEAKTVSYTWQGAHF